MTKKNVNGKKNMTQKSDNEIGKFWNKKKVLTDGMDLCVIHFQKLEITFYGHI